jgi:hypothetical protein
VGAVIGREKGRQYLKTRNAPVRYTVNEAHRTEAAQTSESPPSMHSGDACYGDLPVAPFEYTLQLAMGGVGAEGPVLDRRRVHAR